MKRSDETQQARRKRVLGRYSFGGNETKTAYVRTYVYAHVRVGERGVCGMVVDGLTVAHKE